MFLTSEKRTDPENNMTEFLVLINLVSMQTANTLPRQPRGTFAPWQCSDFTGDTRRLKGNIFQHGQWFLLRFYTTPWCYYMSERVSAFPRDGLCLYTSWRTSRTLNMRKGLGERPLPQVRHCLGEKGHPLWGSTSNPHVKCTQWVQQSSSS